MKLRHSLLAIGLVAIASPAFAYGDTEIHNLTVSADIAETDALVFAFGEFEVSSKSAAVADQTQENVLNASYGDGDHIASFGNNALQGAQGNIGVNVAAGVGNEQANDAALSSVDAGKVFATAMGTSLQIVEGNYAESSDFDTNYTATMDGNALRNARGNIGVNVAAGVGNTQGNTMTGSVNSSGRYAIATSASAQLALGNELNSDTWAFSDLDVYATLGGSALQGAQGNIGVNVVAGVGNAQGNAMAGSVNTSGRYAIATSSSDQLVGANMLDSDGSFFADLDVYATLGGNALSGAQGNIGVNVAAGVGNLQHNGLSIASATGH